MHLRFASMLIVDRQFSFGKKCYRTFSVSSWQILNAVFGKKIYFILFNLLLS